jgi:hypothetical protein
VPRTHGTALKTDDATLWSADLPRSYDVFAVGSRASGARVIVLADERFYPTVQLIRERTTEGWNVSTLSMKES